MESVEYLVIGAGASGLSFASWLGEEASQRGKKPPAMLVIEADSEPGGYCKTVTQDGFVWDYSGHFFHFRHPDIEAWLRARMPGQDIRTVNRSSYIRFAGRDIDFPFQKNIHQLPRQDFIDCLVDLYFRDRDSASAGADASIGTLRRPGAGTDAAASQAGSFKDMLYARFGRSIADKFLVPYNEKLYACDLDELDAGAMGRFFPHADIADIIGNMRRPDNASYNATFTYPLGGAIQYIHALESGVPAGALALGERLEAIDLASQVARTTRRTIRFRRLVSSAPLPALCAMCGLEYDREAFTWNKVLVYNLGFDSKGQAAPHWMYFPGRDVVFYRVGWYDNIMASPRMSLYVEIGARRDEVLDAEALRERVLVDLARAGVVTTQRLISWHSVVLDPAYVHISERSRAEVARLRPILAACGVYPVGRYGSWTYCSIEDNLVETRALARTFAAAW